MPIYEYRCTECHQLFEEWCRHIESASVPHFCPICKGSAQRLVSNTSFALKGGGWYATEYGSRKGVSDDSAPSSKSDDTSKSGDTLKSGDTSPGKEASPAKAESPPSSAAH